MRAFMLATIWLALAGFVVGEAGKTRHFRTGVSPPWVWPVWCAGLVACAIHIAIAMAHQHGWSHASAVMETARQTEAGRTGAYLSVVVPGTVHTGATIEIERPSHDIDLLVLFRAVTGDLAAARRVVDADVVHPEVRDGLVETLERRGS